MVARKARIIAIASTLASSAAFTSTAHATPPADPSDEPPRSPMFRNGAILLPVGLLFGATAGGLAHAAFNPPCREAGDQPLECVPSLGGLVARRYAVSFSGVSSVAGGVLGGLGAGFLTRGLAAQSTDANRAKRKKIMTGVGAGVVSFGLASAVAGTTMFVAGLRGALRPLPESDGTASADEQLEDAVNGLLGKVRLGRSGLGLLMASPTFIAAGAAMLHRRHAFDRPPVRVSFAVSSQEVMLGVSGRF